MRRAGTKELKTVSSTGMRNKQSVRKKRGEWQEDLTQEGDMLRGKWRGKGNS